MQTHLGTPGVVLFMCVAIGPPTGTPCHWGAAALLMPGLLRWKVGWGTPLLGVYGVPLGLGCMGYPLPGAAWADRDCDS